MEKHYSSRYLPNGCSFNRFIHARTFRSLKLLGTWNGWMEFTNRFAFEYFLWCFRIFTSIQLLQCKKTQEEWNQHLYWYRRQLFVHFDRHWYFCLSTFHRSIRRKSFKTCSFNNATTFRLYFDWSLINRLGYHYQDFHSRRSPKLNPFVERGKRRITLQCWQCLGKIHPSTSYREKKLKEKTLIREKLRNILLFFSILF